MAGFYQMAFMFGLALSPALGGVLTDSLGFRPAMHACAAISGAGLMVALVALPETRPPEDRPHLRFWSIAGRQRLLDLAGSWRANAFDRRALLAGAIYLVALFVSSGVLVSTIGLYVGQRWAAGVSLNGVVIGVATLSGLMLAVRALSGMIAGPLAGMWSDRLPDRWPVVRGGILLGVAGFLVLALVLGVWAVPAGVILVAMSASALMTCVAALVGDLARGRRPGTAMGGLATAGDIGSAAGSFAAYALVLLFDLRWIYLLCALALASVLLATLSQRDSAG
jgi:MFS family permease